MKTYVNIQNLLKLAIYIVYNIFIYKDHYYCADKQYGPLAQQSSPTLTKFSPLDLSIAAHRPYLLFRFPI